MKTENILGSQNIQAAANLTASRFVGFDGNACGANAKALGVVLADTDSGNMAPLAISGIVLVKSGGAVSVGGAVTSDATGRAVAAAALAATVASGATSVTSTAANGAIVALAGATPPVAVNGYALDEATDADQFIRVLLA